MSDRKNGSEALSHTRLIWARGIAHFLGAVFVFGVPYVLSRGHNEPPPPVNSTKRVEDPPPKPPVNPEPRRDQIRTTPLLGSPPYVPLRRKPDPLLNNVVGSVNINVALKPIGEEISPSGVRWFRLRCGGPIHCWAGAKTALISSCRTNHPDEPCPSYVTTPSPENPIRAERILAPPTYNHISG